MGHATGLINLTKVVPISLLDNEKLDARDPTIFKHLAHDLHRMLHPIANIIGELESKSQTLIYRVSSIS